MAGRPRPIRDIRELLTLPDGALITEPEAGAILSLSPATLRNRRLNLPDRPARPIGPHVKIGRSIRYRIATIRRIATQGEAPSGATPVVITTANLEHLKEFAP